MKPDPEIIAIIAEACGWKNLSVVRHGDGIEYLVGVRPGYPEYPNPTTYSVSDYLNSIDAIQQAVLEQDDDFQQLFNERMINRVGHFFIHRFTARDWCECFVEVWEQLKKDKK